LDASYRLGLTIVAGAVVLAGAAAASLPKRTPPPAAQDLDDDPRPLGAFRLVERSGEAVTDADLAGKVWIADFVFSRCPSSCPRLTAELRTLQDKLKDTGVRLVTVTVDPEYDSPEVLARFAGRYGADPDRWWFLTGPPADVQTLIRNRFLLTAMPTDAQDQANGAERIMHDSRFVLVDRGNKVVGYFDSASEDARKALEAKARRLDRLVPWARRLPAVNAALNASSAALLVAAWVLIRGRNVRGHAACNVAALLASALFLTCYLVYHYQVGSVPYCGQGPWRVAYFTVLLSHTVLAVAVVPLVAVTLSHTIRRRFERHARIARVTFPVWLYVSLTGVVIYVMLYQLPAPLASPASG
jgi:protein SCO1/2/putative membrane protein